jgi:hypothetical protein
VHAALADEEPVGRVLFRRVFVKSCCHIVRGGVDFVERS